MSERILITDVVWDDIDIERRLLGEAGYEAVLAEDTDEAALAAAAVGATGILTCFARVSAPVIDAAEGLRAISRFGVGVDNIDTDRAAELGVPVVRVAEYCSNEVAVHTVALALACWRRLPGYQRAMSQGRWGTTAQSAPVRRAEGARAAVLGRGRIGQRVAAALEAVGFVVGEEVDGADLLTVHVPLAPQTERLVDEPLLSRLAPGAVVVNTSRGGVLDLDAALRCLDDGRLSGLGLDVFPTEPLPSDAPVLGRGDVVLTPHVAFYSAESLVELREKACRNLLEALAGR